MHSIQITKEHWQQMQEHAVRTAPIEACGLVAGKENQSWEVYPITNSLESKTRFRMAEAELVSAMYAMLEKGWGLLAIYHSHPQGPAKPSPTDLAEASFLDSVHLIWAHADSEWDVRAYMYDADRQAQEISISVV